MMHSERKKSPGHDGCTHIAAMCLIASDNLFLKSFLCVVKRESEENSRLFGTSTEVLNAFLCIGCTEPKTATRRKT
jgi:hypothetical protein